MDLEIPTFALVIIGCEGYEGCLGNINEGCEGYECCLGRFNDCVEEECCSEVKIDVGDDVEAKVTTSDLLLLLAARTTF